MDEEQKQPTKEHKLQVRVDTPFYLAIIREAKHKKKDVSKLIREAIRKEINYKEKPVI